ncbi:MAG: hypothetical protein H6R07_2097 [Proteobacteria bacterium]|nr:hypothetical protein [Pseudomonadota bacterium]
MAGITGAGTIDVESLVTQLMVAEKKPLTKLASKEATLQSKISMIGQFKSLISGLQSTATGLQNLGKLNGIKATVGNTTALSVTATNEATAASYSLDVLQLAKAQQVVSKSGTFTSASDVLVAAGTQSGTGVGVATAKLSINFGTVAAGNFTADTTKLKEISIAVGAGGITLQNVADAINGGDYGVKASLISDKSGSVRLALNGDDTGAENAFKLDVSYLDSLGASITPAATPALSTKLDFNPAQTSTYLEIPSGGTAVDSKVNLNGVEITRASNTIDDAVDGLTFTLKTTTIPDGSTTSTPTTVTVARDAGAISTQLKTFVDSYNQIASAIKSTTGYNAETKVAGALQGDPTIRGMQTQLRSLVNSTFGDGTNSTKTLSSLGISFKKDGTLALDSTKLSTAVANDLDGVIEFLGAFDQTVSTVAPNSSKDGFAYKLEQLTKSMLADDGLIDSKLDGLNKIVKDVEKQYERVESRLVQIEKRYRAQYTAMDTAVSNMQNLSGYVTQLLNMTSSSSS